MCPFFCLSTHLCQLEHCLPPYSQPLLLRRDNLLLQNLINTLGLRNRTVTEYTWPYKHFHSSAWISLAWYQWRFICTEISSCANTVFIHPATVQMSPFAVCDVTIYSGVLYSTQLYILAVTACCWPSFRPFMCLVKHVQVCTGPQGDSFVLHRLMIILLLWHVMCLPLLSISLPFNLTLRSWAWQNRTRMQR